MDSLFFYSPIRILIKSIGSQNCPGNLTRNEGGGEGRVNIHIVFCSVNFFFKSNFENVCFDVRLLKNSSCDMYKVYKQYKVKYMTIT